MSDNLPAVVPVVRFQFKINFGTVFVNHHGDKPYSIDRWVTYEPQDYYVFADGSMELKK